MPKKTSESYVRVLTVEVASLSEDKKEHWRMFNEIRDAMVLVQEVQNFFFDMWRAWHFKNGSAAKLRKFHEEWTEYLKLGKGKAKAKRPKCDVNAIEPALSKDIYHKAVKQWPSLNARMVSIVLHRLEQLVRSSKSAKGNWPGWHSWLLHRQQIPQYTGPGPICVDKQTSKLIPPDDSKDSFKFKFTSERVDRPGSKIKKGVSYTALIWDKGKRMLSRKLMLKKMMDGPGNGGVALKSSQLFIKDNKLFIALCYEMPKPKLSAGTGTAVVMPSRRSPFIMRMPGSTRRRIGGDGRVVAQVRRQLTAQRWSRQESYRRSASSARKGHGRHRAIQKVTMLSNCWRDFVRTYNRNMAIEVCKAAAAAGCGLIVLCKRPGEIRWLQYAGKQSARDSTGWDWYGFEKAVNDKAVEFGLTVLTRTVRERKKPGENQAA